MSLSATPEKQPALPRHVALIMDGNRRWARARGSKEIEGHFRSIERVKEIVEESIRRGVKNLTFWAFSTENWRRHHAFINDIFSVFRFVLEKRTSFFEELTQNGGHLHILGDVTKFPQDIVQKIGAYLKEPAPVKKTIDVNFALNYGGRDELLRAFHKIVEAGYKPNEISTAVINNHLDTAGQPDVDLMIRTGGELRTSGFLMWQLNYAEFYFTKTFFPDFGKREFQKALDDYAQRERRFGGDAQPKT